MPLPSSNIPWPPEDLAPILTAYHEYDSWISGDTDALRGIYHGGGTHARPSQYAGGVVGAVSRFFWGAPDPSDDVIRMHAPLAADVCRVNSDLLFGDPITATVTPTTRTVTGEDGAETVEEVQDEKTQDRLNLILESAHAVFVGAAELSAGLGGTFLRATWDSEVHDHPFITKVDADLAYPVFRWGRLVGVTFWRTLAEENATVWRHLECHELEDGVGVIRHGLYEGTKDHLGTRREYTLRPETAWLAEQELADGDTISTQTPGLDVVYIRNLEQSKVWRKHPLGANLGRSDLEGLLGELDAYDKAYTSLMRDLEDGKSRLIVSEDMLESNGPGNGVSFHDRSIFTPVSAPPGKADGAAMPIEHVQFKIRVEEHLAIMADILYRVVRASGYAPRSFGLGGEPGSGNKTATEIDSEDALSQQTRKRKIRAWEPELERLLSKCLAIDAKVLAGGGNPEAEVDVTFAEANRVDPFSLAKVVQTLRLARAASTETLVRIFNPSADETWIEDEVARIAKEDENAFPMLPDPDDRPPGTELTDGANAGE